MKKFEQYGQRKDEEWEWFPWLPWWLRAACNDEERMRYYFNRGSLKLTEQN